MEYMTRVSSRIFCLGGKIVCKDQLCVKHAKFLSPFLSINHQCTKEHKARVDTVDPRLSGHLSGQTDFSTCRISEIVRISKSDNSCTL